MESKKTILIVTRSTHEKYPYCVLNKDHRLVGHFKKLGDIRKHYLREIHMGSIELKRELNYVFDNQKHIDSLRYAVYDAFQDTKKKYFRELKKNQDWRKNEIL